MTGLIGQCCKHCEVLRRLVLIARLIHMAWFVLGEVFASFSGVWHTTATAPVTECGDVGVGVSVMVVLVVIVVGSRPVPFRTRKLSPPAPMVLHSGECGRVGNRQP